MTLEQLEELGATLARGGLAWAKYLDRARELWCSVKRGGKADWSLEHAERLARALGLTKHPIAFGTHCPRCPPPQSDNAYPSTRTLLSLPDRYVAECTRCGSQWARLTQRHHLEPRSRHVDVSASV